MEKEKTFKKVLNPLDILVTAFGAMIGWGWVVSTGSWLQKAGTLGTVAGFLIGGTMIYLIGLIYSELTTAMPLCGGVLVFSSRAMGPVGAYACSWMMVLSYIGVVCFEACAIPTVLQYIFPGFLQGYLYTVAGFPVYASWLAVAAVTAVFITWINVLGVKAAAMLQTVLTVSIGLIGLILMGAALFNGSPQNLQGQLLVGEDFGAVTGNILSVAVVAPFFLFGFDVIPQVAEEIDVPLKKIGRLMLLSIILAVVFYAGVVFSVGYILTPSMVAESAAGDGLVTADAMARAFSSKNMAKVLILGGICGIVTSWNSFLMGGSRVIYSMAEARMLPAFLGKLHQKYQTPSHAIYLIGLLSVASVFLGRSMLTWISNTASFGCCTAYCMVSISFLILRKREPHMERPYRVKHHRLVGILAAFMSAGMAGLYLIPGTSSSFGPQERLIAAGWILLGLIFAVSCRHRYGRDFGVIA